MQEASRLQGMERQGEVYSRQAELNKQSTLLGMSQQETAAYAEQAAQADAAGMNALASGIGGATDMLTAGLGQSDHTYDPTKYTLKKIDN